MAMNTLFHAAFCSAQLFGRCQIWPMLTFAGTFSDSRTFRLSDFRTFGYGFHSSLGMCLSLRLAPASPALEGGTPPLNPPLHTQYLPTAKRYNWIFVIFRDIPDLKWSLNHSNRIQNGHLYPVPCSILQCASFWSVSNLADFEFFRDILGLTDFRTFGLSDFRVCLPK